MTLLQLAFLGENNLNFPWEKSQWDNTVDKKQDAEKFAQALGPNSLNSFLSQKAGSLSHINVVL